MNLGDEASVVAALRDALASRADVPGWDEAWFAPSEWVERGAGFAIATNRLRRWQEHRSVTPGPIVFRPVTVWQRALICAADPAADALAVSSIDVSRFQVAGWR